MVYGLVALLAWSAYVESEWWPASSFRLFSHLRSESSAAWRVVRVDGAGNEHPLDVARFGRGYRSAAHLLGRLDDAGRRDACDTWAAAAAGHGLDVAGGVRVYRLVTRLATEPAPHVVTVRRTLRVACDP